MSDDKPRPPRAPDTTREDLKPVAPPRVLGPACLVVLYPPGPDMGRRLALDKDELVLGRENECDFAIESDTVSRRHARVHREGGDWELEDLQSTNGTYLNDALVKRSPLGDGDLVRIGAAIFKFLSGSGIEAAYHEEIYRMTIVDALTGAHNKRFFLDFLERELARCARYERPLSLLMLDIDHFKRINDERGHLAGDAVLRGLSRRLLARVRKEELLSRYGGEEFAIVLPEADVGSARDTAEKFRALVAAEPFEYAGQPIPVTISVGVAGTRGEALDPLALIESADQKLYEAKRGGRNRVAG